MNRHVPQDALEYVPNAILLIEHSGQIVFANWRAEGLFGYLRAELSGHALANLLSARSRAKVQAYLDRCADGSAPLAEGFCCDILARRGDGSEFPAEISLSRADERDRALVLAVIRDVSDRKRVESDLIAAREAADQASSAKSRFLAMASHDLRQPLQALSLLNGALRRLVTDPDIAEVLVHQEQAIGTMSQLVNTLLDISKLESGLVRPQLADFSIAPLLQELHQEFRTLAAHKGLVLDVEPSVCVVRSDPSLVGQILRNLLSNAIKYTRDGRVALRSGCDAGVCTIEVVDTGIGIPADQMAHIYDEFFQVTVAAGESRQGYGLGLSIVSRLVSLLGLKLEAQSEPGKGSTFCLQLPFSSMRSATNSRAAQPLAS